MKKLIKVISELKAPKNQRNDFGKYNYRSTEDIVEAVKPLLTAEGLLLNVTDEIVLVGERYYIKATATIADGESVVSSTGWAREDENKKGMDASQLTGATSSYARKYALNGLFAIDDTKDSDATNDHGNGKQKTEKPTAKELSEAQIKRLYAIGKKVDVTAGQINSAAMKDYGKTNPKLLSKTEYDELCERLENKKEAE